MFDPDCRPTAFQWRVLNLVRSLGPIEPAALQKHFHQHGLEAIRSACWRLRAGGYLQWQGEELEVTAAGRHVIELHQRLSPRIGVLQRLVSILKRQPAPFASR